ncbi:MAG: hypothetical protein AAGA58_07425 [Verrucomicrobiota bacterium]
MAKRRPNEVRFTRSARAPFFLALGVAMLLLSVWMYFAGTSGRYETSKGVAMFWSGWWALIPFVVALLSLEMGRLLSRRAYVLVNAIAIEIFPLFGAPKGMRVLPWPEVTKVDFEETLDAMTVKLEEDEVEKISLKPIARHQREFLKRAIEGRVEEMAKSAVE